MKNKKVFLESRIAYHENKIEINKEQILISRVSIANCEQEIKELKSSLIKHKEK